MIGRVVDKFIFEFEAQLEEKGVSLTVDDEARTWIAIKGYDPKMGARPMARILQQYVKKPMAEELLFGDLTHGGSIHIHVEKDELAFKVTSKEKVTA